MELKEAIEILEKHNYWRRDNSVPSETEMISPKELGIAIDKIVKHFKNNVLLHNVSNCFSKEDLQKAWLHGCIRVPKEMKHINNFEAYYELIKK